MSAPEKVNLKDAIKNIHSNFNHRIEFLLCETNGFKKIMDSVFADFTEQCIDIEDRLKDVLKQKEVILAEYEILKRKDKEGCKKCSIMKVNLTKASGKLKQYELKLKDVANLLDINTALTDAHQMDTNMIESEKYQYVIDADVNSQADKASTSQKKAGKLSHNLSSTSIEKQKINSETTLGDDTENRNPASKILVHEEEDDVYFETTLKRKTPDDAETVLEIPETFCEEIQHLGRGSRAQVENSPLQGTPSKKRKLHQPSPQPDCTGPTSPLQERNKPVTTKMDSPSLISKSFSTGKPRFKKVKTYPEKCLVPANLDHFNEEEIQLISTIEYAVNENASGDLEESEENNETRFVFESKTAKQVYQKNQISVKDKNIAKNALEKKLNTSQTIEFSDDSDDFINTSKFRKETSFAKPAEPENSKNTKWNLKLLSRSTEKSKLKQAKLTVEKKVSKIDITQVEGYSGGILPDTKLNISVQEAQGNEHLMKETKKLIIEETQEFEQEAFDEEVGSNTGNMNDLTLPEESMFIPNAMSTQKQERIINKLPIKTQPTLSPGKANSSNPGETGSKTTIKNNPCTARKTSLVFKRPSNRDNLDYTPQWKCAKCIDYFIESYGAPILKIRPPPKRCGHKERNPSNTPPDFWDPMCS